MNLSLAGDVHRMPDAAGSPLALLHMLVYLLVEAKGEGDAISIH
jgi:hypothetical protein